MKTADVDYYWLVGSFLFSNKKFREKLTHYYKYVF